MYNILLSKEKAFGFIPLLILLPIPRAQELVPESHGQVAVDDHADIRTTPNEILKSRR